MRFKEFVSQHWLTAVPVHYHIYRLPLLVFAALFIAGHGLGKWLVMPHPVWVIAITLVVLGPALASLHLKQQRKLASELFIFAALLMGIAYRGLTVLPASDDLTAVATREWQPCAVQARIISAAVWMPNPNHREGVINSERWITKWDVHCVAIRHRERWLPIQATSTLSTAGRIDNYLPGDTLQIHGHLRLITPPTNPGGFDFAEHAQRDAMFVMLRSETVAQLQRIDSAWGWNSLSRLRGLAIREIDKSLVRWVRFDQAPLAAALVFGQRQQVDWQDQQELMATGTLHMLAISGLHVEIVAGLLLAACTVLGVRPRTTFICLLLATWGYAGLSGAQPPVIRAAVQVTAFAFARWIGGKARLGNMLGAAAIVLFVMRSTNLQEVGVQLSFLAVGTIGLFASTTRASRKRDRLQAVIDETLPSWWLWWRWLRLKIGEMTYLSFWVTLFTCPLIWTNFHVISPIAIVLNVLISIPLTVALLSGLSTGLLGWLLPVGVLSGYVCGAALSVITVLVSWGHHVPAGHIWLPAPSLWWTTVFYLFAIGWLLLLGRKRLPLLGSLLIVWLVVGVAPWLHGARGQIDGLRGLAFERTAVTELRCTFLNVGHGTCVVLELPTGEVWLYDAGHMGAAERSHQDIAAALWALGTARIDHLVLSHADADHYNAVSGLLERFAVGTVVSTQQFWTHPDREVQTLIAHLKHHRCRLATWMAPLRMNHEQVDFSVLHPNAFWQAATDNADSLCLVVEYAGIRLLLPGDLEGAGILQLTSLPARPCHVVMAPHHGSLTLDPANLLEWCQPHLVVISGGNKATRPDVLQRYSQIPSQLAITYRDGAIQVRIDNQGQMSAWNWNDNAWQEFSSP